MHHVTERQEISNWSTECLRLIQNHLILTYWAQNVLTYVSVYVVAMSSVFDWATFLCAGESELSRQRWMFEQQALQEYILLCCQNPTGGLLDKPGKSVPHHLDTHTHTLQQHKDWQQQHTLSTLLNTIHVVLFRHVIYTSQTCVVSSCVSRSRDFYHTCYCLSGLSIAQHFGNMDLHHEMILGREENRLVRIR